MSTPSINTPNDPRLVAAHYDPRAEKYPYEEAKLAHFVPQYRKFLREHSPARLLDIGCGPGHLSGPLTRRLSVTGIDLSPGMVAHAAKKYPAGTWRVHDFHQPLPFNPGSFDTVVATGAFEFCYDIATVLKHVAAVLEPDGWLFFTHVDRRAGSGWHAAASQQIASDLLPGVKFFLWSCAEVAVALEEAGLTADRYEHGPGWFNKRIGGDVEYGYWRAQKR